MVALLALMSSLMWGAADFLGGTASRRRPAWQVVVWSQTIAGVVLIIAVLASGASRGIEFGPWFWWALLAGILGGAGLLTFYAALAQGTMGVVSPIAAMGVLIPLIVGLVSGDRLTSMQAVGVGAAVIGIVLASGPELSARSPWRPVLLAGCAAVFFGGALLGIAQGSKTSVLMTMLVMRSFSVTVFVIALLGWASMRQLRRAEIWPLIVIGAMDVAANVCFGWASSMGALAIVSVLGSIYPIVTVALAWFVHKERLAPIQYAGIAAAMAGVALISLP